MRKLNQKMLLIIAAIAISIIGSSITYAYMTTRDRPIEFKVSDSDDSYSLDLLSSSETMLCPGLLVETPFDIYNDTEKKINFKGISFKDFGLIDMGSNNSIPVGSSRYNDFLDNVYLSFKNENSIVFNLPLSEILQNDTYTFEDSIAFFSKSKHSFSISISMLESAHNNLQNIKADLNIIFNFDENLTK